MYSFQICLLLMFGLSNVNCSYIRGWAPTCDELQSEIQEIQDNYVSYSFRLTPIPGDFEKSRFLCNEMGGDLITHNLDHQGTSRYEEIRELVEHNINGKRFWIGLNDRGNEGNFRLVNGTAYDVTDVNQPALYRWRSDEPNNSPDASDITGIDEDCVHIHINAVSGDVIGLNDYPCHMDYWYTDSSIEFYGLCEILNYRCIPSR